MNDLCTIETVGFVLRLELQQLPTMSFKSDFFQHLTAWIFNGPLSSDDLHKLKLNLITSIGHVAGWIPCKTYVSIGAIMTAAIQTLSLAESSLFNSISTVTRKCHCSTTTKLFHQPILYIEEKLTNSTLSLQAALNHIVDYNVQMPGQCQDCGKTAVEHSEFNNKLRNKSNLVYRVFRFVSDSGDRTWKTFNNLYKSISEY